MIGETVRCHAFWMMDAIKHSAVKNRIEYFRQLDASGERINHDGLAALIGHAISTVPYYRDHYAGAKSITDFPVVSKDIYRAQFDSFRSDLFQIDKQLHAVFTSGSTGNPFKAYQDKGKLNNHKAGLILLNQEIGWELGARYMFIRAWGTHFSSGLKNLATNVVPVEATGLTDEKALEVCKKIADDKSLKLILGYASSLEIISECALKNGNKPADFGIDLIISDSECLKPEVKRKIKKAFDCPVLNRYANNENGIIAITDDETDSFHVNFKEYYVELLKLESDEPIEMGGIGRIVITDIYNKAFPFIRYDTGDLGIASEMCDGQVLTFSQIVGRAADSMTDMDGNILGEAVATAVFEDYTALRRYQLIQRDSDYIIRIEKPFNGDEGEILRRAHKVIGNRAKISVEYSDHIPCEKNGKFKTMIRIR